jgi:hypothetical protein
MGSTNSPAQKASLLSKSVFFFMYELFLKAFKKEIKVEDLWELPPTLKAEAIHDLFQKSNTINGSKKLLKNKEMHKSAETNGYANEHLNGSQKERETPMANIAAFNFFHSLHWNLFKCYWKRILVACFLR